MCNKNIQEIYEAIKPLFLRYIVEEVLLEQLFLKVVEEEDIENQLFIVLLKPIEDRDRSFQNLINKYRIPNLEDKSY